jgi:L-alanine-DL-glutamate epimerase-like enolase superfamily enzyme
MKLDRRNFCKAAFTVPLAVATGKAFGQDLDSSSDPSGSYDNEHAKHNIIEEGLKILRIETYTKETVGVVKVQTDDGSVGYGILSPHDAKDSSLMLHKYVARHFLGKDPAHIDDLEDKCIESNYKRPCTYIYRALTGVDTAIWDLYGRLKNRPVVELLGGKVRGIPAYGSSMSRKITPEDEASRMIALRDSKGFSAFKLRVGSVTGHDKDAWPGRTETLVPTVRKSLGNKIELMADANSCYTPPKAIAVGRLLEDNNVSFFEEPCPYWELEWTAEVAKELQVPIAGGEQDNHLAQWRRMIKMNAVDIVQPDIGYIGGFTRALRVAKMGEKAGMLCVPHSSSYSMMYVFTLHLLGAIPNYKYIESTIDDTSELNKESRAMYDPFPKVEDGKAMIPDGPGWGVTIKKEWLESAEYQMSGK